MRKRYELPCWAIERHIAGCAFTAMIDLGAWTVMACFERGPAAAGLGSGPFRIFLRRDAPDTAGRLGWTLVRLLVPRRSLELRFGLDFGFWAFGYAMADAHDHGLYFGPLDLQIEYDKGCREPNWIGAWLEISL